MRVDFDEYCMEVAETVAKRSTCLRRQVGAVIVVGKHIVATGYNGAAAELDHCDEKGECRRNILGIASGTDLMNCEAVHSEANAIIQCAVHATSPAGGTLYCTHAPCCMCAKMIVNAGIKRVVYRNTYPNLDEVKNIFTKAGVELQHMP